MTYSNIVARRHRRRKPRRELELDIILFSVLVSIFVIGRILMFYALLPAQACMDLEPRLFGSDAPLDGIIDWLLAASLAGLGMLGAMSVNRILMHNFTPVSIFFGLCNASVALLLALSCGLFWAFFNPDSFLARQLNGMEFQSETSFQFRDSYHWYGTFEGIYGWEKIGPDAYWNEEIEITAKLEIVGSCFPAPMIRKNLEARYPSGFLSDGRSIISLDDATLEHQTKRFVFYDNNDQYITSDYYFDHHRYKSLRERDKYNESHPPLVSRWRALSLVDGSLHDAYLAENTVRQHPYTLEEIEAMVRETWDREAPMED